MMVSRDILNVLGNKYNPEILELAHEPRSAKEFSELLDVPIATCYRRIDELTDADLLEHHDRVLTDGQRRTSLYRRNVDVVKITFDTDTVTIDLEEHSPVKHKLDNVWKNLPDA